MTIMKLDSEAKDSPPKDCNAHRRNLEILPQVPGVNGLYNHSSYREQYSGL